MKNVKKAVVLILAVLAILLFAFTNAPAFASTIQAKNESNTTNTSNTENTTNTSNSTNNTSISNSSINTIPSSSPIATTKTINTTNTNENLPDTGVEDTYLNFALILLLALVLGMFSLVQYKRIIKKEDE